MSNDTKKVVESTYYYSMAREHNNRLDEVIALLESYSMSLATKKTEASFLLEENCSLMTGITTYIEEIKSKIDKCNDSIRLMKNISISKARAKDDEINARNRRENDNE